MKVNSFNELNKLNNEYIKEKQIIEQELNEKKQELNKKEQKFNKKNPARITK